jgi:integrase/recombinase XerD
VIRLGGPVRESRNLDGLISRELPVERETTVGPERRGRRGARRLDAGPFTAEVGSFRLHLAAENKAAATIRIYTEAPLWFAAAHLLCETGKTRWEQVDAQDVQRWVTWLLGDYSEAYVRQQYRSLRQFFLWLAAEDEVADPMAKLRAPAVREKPVPVLPALNFRGWRGRAGATRSHSGVTRRSFRCSGRRASGWLSWPRSAMPPTTRVAATWTWSDGRSGSGGKGGRDRTVRIGHEAARCLDRYLRVGARHEQAHRLGLWLGTGGRGPLTANGIYQMVKRRGGQAGVEVWPHRFRHHFSHTWLDRGGTEGDLMELNGWSSPQMLQRYGGSVRGARARRHYDLIMRD